MATHDDRPLLTREEYERHRLRLHELRRVRDDDLPELLRAARGLVASDAAEELIQMRDDHAMVAARIRQLEDVLREARVVDQCAHEADCVVPGRLVTLRYVSSGREVSYRLGAAGGAAERGVSVRSPVGQAILGRCIGDIVAVELPGGRREELLITAVGPQPPSEGGPHDH